MAIAAAAKSNTIPGLFPAGLRIKRATNHSPATSRIAAPIADATCVWKLARMIASNRNPPALSSVRRQRPLRFWMVWKIALIIR